MVNRFWRWEKDNSGAPKSPETVDLWVPAYTKSPVDAESIILRSEEVYRGFILRHHTYKSLYDEEHQHILCFRPSEGGQEILEELLYLISFGDLGQIYGRVGGLPPKIIGSCKIYPHPQVIGLDTWHPERINPIQEYERRLIDRFILAKTS